MLICRLICSCGPHPCTAAISLIPYFCQVPGNEAMLQRAVVICKAAVKVIPRPPSPALSLAV